MNPIEDQITAATQAEASALREVRPLRLPPAPAAAPGAGGSRSGRTSRIVDASARVAART